MTIYAKKSSVAKVKVRLAAIESKPAGAGGAALTVKEGDGAPTVANVDTIVVSNGTLTDDGGGQVTVTTSGGAAPPFAQTDVTGLQGYYQSSTTDLPMSRITGLSTYFRSTATALVQGDTTGLTGYYQSSTAALAMSRITGLSTYFMSSANPLPSGQEAADHGTAATDQIVNVCYGTAAAPNANTTTEGTLWIKYTA